eukprot:2559427-Amphidinium_carterae.1
MMRQQRGAGSHHDQHGQTRLDPERTFVCTASGQTPTKAACHHCQGSREVGSANGGRRIAVKRRPQSEDGRSLLASGRRG